MSSNLSLLLVDDDPLIGDSLRLLLPKQWQLKSIHRLADIPTEGFFHAAFVDLHLTPKMETPEGPEAIRAIKQRFPKTEVIAISGDLNVKLMETCLDAGAVKFLAKPLLADEVRASIEKLEALWGLREIETRPGVNRAQWIGDSKASEALRQQVARLHGEKGPILIEGETGTGKEVVAQLLHQLEPGRPLVSVNVGAIPENLFESEFFGHSKGAFTGADAMKIGLCEAANGGDLFLDEIEALPLNQQVKLLRFLESGEIRRVGAKESIHVQTRVIAATNRNLENMVKEGTFREDLLFRLKARKIVLTPLRERIDDLEPLAKFFLAQQRPRANKMLTPETIASMRKYDWPGNVRELKRFCEQVALTSPLPMVRPADAIAFLGSDSATSREDASEESLPLNEQVERFEARAIKRTLASAKGVDDAAERLGISRSSLYKKLKDYGIEV